MTTSTSNNSGGQATPAQPPHTETLVREYKSSGAYAKDAAKLGKDGWVATSVIEKRAGVHWLASILLLLVFIVPGLLALLFWRKRRILVTYARTAA